MNAWKSRGHSREAFAVAAAIAAATGCGGDDSSATSLGTGGGTAVSSSNTTGSMASTGSTTTTGSMASTGSTTTTGSMAGTGGGSSTGSMTGTGGTGTTGSMAGTGGGGTGGATTTGSMTGAGGSTGCPTPTQATVATHITMNVTWPGTIGINAGSGVVHIWTLATQMFNGNNITGTGRPCGSIIPDLTATPLAGGMKIGNTIPDATWDSPSMPTTTVSGMHTGFDVGSTVSINKNASVVGATMPNPLTDAWPMSYTGLMTADHDGDGKAGITATPKSGPGYQLPPLNLFMTGRADKLYLATRSILSLSGTRDTCDTVSGTATMEKFDNHVVGCHVLNGAECMPPDIQFIDDNRTIFVIGTATYKATNLAAGATCADARAALP